ncbi:MAG: insulinase family protein [Gammaproteobacteria bacterium]|nr:insulinase family protein [Gammaproteobacteria bacterium]
MPLLLLLMTMFCVSARAATPNTSEYTLSNGLRLIVQEDHRAPVAVVQVWYRVGGSDEHDGITGISHALEHLMFKRTRNLATGEFSRRVAQRGGTENAFTSADYTAYYQQWAASNVAESFRLEAERMQHLMLDPEEVANELKVIREERRLRTEDDPGAAAFERILAATWQTSPYRQPVIGWAADIEQMQLEEIRDWYARYYIPNNAVVVVVGDVQPEALRTLAEDTFGKIPARPLPAAKVRPEVPQQGLKRLEILDPRLRVPTLVMNYKVPGLTQVGRGEGAPEHWEIYALDVLAALLDGGASARLSREMVRNGGAALSASANYSGSSRLMDLFSFEGVPRNGVGLADLEQAFREQIERIKQNPPGEEELARIKTGVIAADIYQRDSPLGQAMIIGSLVAVGIDWRLRDSYVEDIEAITPAQVQAVARKYFRDEVATIAWLLPEARHD